MSDWKESDYAAASRKVFSYVKERSVEEALASYLAGNDERDGLD